MEQAARPQAILLSEKGTIKSVSATKLILETAVGTSLEIYIPAGFPYGPGDAIEIRFEATILGLIGRQAILLKTGETLPLLPHDFLLLSEYLRFGFFSLLGVIAIILLSINLPLYFFAPTIIVLLIFLTFFYWSGAVVFGQHLPNYHQIKIIPYDTISSTNLAPYFPTHMPQPLFLMQGILTKGPSKQTNATLSHGGRDFDVALPLNVSMAKSNRLESNFIVHLQDEDVTILGQLDRNDRIFWNLGRLLSFGLYIEIIGYIFLFLSSIPGYFLYGLGTVPFVELSLPLFITCLFCGNCLIFIGKLAKLKKIRYQNSLIIDYKNPNDASTK